VGKLPAWIPAVGGTADATDARAPQNRHAPRTASPRAQLEGGLTIYLIHMRPEQVQDAVARNVPVLMPAGCVEYHGPHLPIGTDFLIANSICVEAEKRVECVMAPPLQFAPTLDWAAGPEEGEADFDPEAFFQYARESLRRIAAMGFRRIYILQHHQGPDGLEVLCLKRAAMEVVRETVHEWGAGWGRGSREEVPNPESSAGSALRTSIRSPNTRGPIPAPCRLATAAKERRC